PPAERRTARRRESRAATTRPSARTPGARTRSRGPTRTRETRDIASGPSNRLQREVLFFQRDVVFELVERQARSAVATQVGHLELPRRPDALHVADVGVGEPPHDFVLDEVLDARERIVV